MINPFKKKRRRRRRSSPYSSRGIVRNFSLSRDTARGVATVVVFTLAFFSILSFFEATGSAGQAITTTLAKSFGWADWLFPLLLLVLAYYLIRPNTYEVKIINYIGFALIIFGVTGLLHLPVRDVPLENIVASGRGGGFVGYFAGHFLYQTTALVGSFLILLAATLIGAFIFFNMSFSRLGELAETAKEKAGGFSFRRNKSDDTEEEIEEPYEEEIEEEDEVEEDMDDDMEEPSDDDVEPEEDEEPQPKRKKTPPKIKLPINLLTAGSDIPASGDIKAGMKKIEETFKSFNIDVTMGEVNVGPTVTQYTLKPTEGVKLNQITALQSDLALALAAHPIRIEAPIPGKSLVGIEVPNQSVSMVRLRTILESPVYKGRKSNLMVPLGQDVAGKAVMADLGKMPHLLIAGATGSGKSVSINTMITSLLYQNGPDMLQLILVDPKRVELSSYDNIPHLVAPVITEVDKTVNALRWAVKQMDDRYRLLQAAGKRNIDAYNNAVLVDKMPYIVIIIDELADLMMVAAKEVEAAIIRLAQMARAVGIHLIVATQRPSVNVITGLIKANIPARIAFSVASLTDSRTILDTSGAEKLLGNGDMLYMSAELSKPKRIQGAFISDEEITAVTDFLKKHGEPDYDAAVTEKKGNSVGGGYGSDDDDAEIQEAINVVVRAQRASATLLQSRMRIGFAKASRILDELEDRGIIGPQNSSKPREVLITQEELDKDMASESAPAQAMDDDYDDSDEGYNEDEDDNVNEESDEDEDEDEEESGDTFDDEDYEEEEDEERTR